MDVRYVSVFFAAVATRLFSVKVDLGNLAQVAEVSEVFWADAPLIRFYDTPDRRLETVATAVFGRAKRFIRGDAPLLQEPALFLRLLRQAARRKKRARKKEQQMPPAAIK